MKVKLNNIFLYFQFLMDYNQYRKGEQYNDN